MRAGPKMLALLLSLALAAPGAAFAQSAGDDQYVDPFADQGSQGGGGGNSGSQGGGSQGGDTSAQPPAETLVAPEPAPVAPSASAAPTTSGTAQTLPVTGLPALGLALAGVFLLACGTTLRRRV
jgi:hypothetical protein